MKKEIQKMKHVLCKLPTMAAHMLPLEFIFGANTRIAKESYMKYGDCDSQVFKPKRDQEAGGFPAVPGSRPADGRM